MAIRWSNWKVLGKPAEAEISRPAVQRNQDGRQEVFVKGNGGIFTIWQIAPNGAWSERWGDLGKPARAVIQTHAIATNQDGRQELFAVGDDGGLWQKWQVAPNGGWSDWQGRSAPDGNKSLGEQFSVGKNQDGRQELFAIAKDGNVWQTWQTAPNVGWSDWKMLGKPPVGFRPADRISTAVNEDGRQELFAIGADNALWHVWQTGPNGGWSDWATLGKPADRFDGTEPPKERDISQPVVARNTDGHLEVFAPGNGAFCNRWQEEWRRGADAVRWRHQGWNAKPRPRPTVELASLEAARNFEQRLEVFGFANDGALWHAWQVDESPFWSTWESLASPPPGIRAADRLSVGKNRDGRLEIFVMGQDGAVWQIWQIR